MKTILVTGANGYLASLCMKEHPEFNYIKMTRKNADLSNPDAVEAYLSDLKFDICFHTAANATTALCEQNPEETMRVSFLVELNNLLMEKKTEGHSKKRNL